MKKVNRVTLLSIVSGLSIICLLAISMALDIPLLPRQTYLAQTPPSALRQVQNMAEHIKVVSAEILKTGGKTDLRLKLLNLMPGKKLTAIVITGADPHSWLEFDIAYSDLPEHQIGTKGEFVVTIEDIEEGQLTFVRSAVFEGPIIEGDLHPALNIVNKRVGEKLALTQILREVSVLEKSLTGQPLASGLSSLKHKVESIPELTETEAFARQEMIALGLTPPRKINTMIDKEVLAMQINIGIQHGKERAFHQFSNLENDTDVSMFRSKISLMRKQWEELLGRL